MFRKPVGPTSQGPTRESQSGVRTMGTDNTVSERRSPAADPPPVIFWQASHRFLRHILEDKLVDMSELIVDCLSMLPGDESNKLHNPRRHPVTSFIDWAQCFTHYSAIVSLANPERTLDLLGYQYLISKPTSEMSGLYMTAVFFSLQPPNLSLSGHREMETYGRQSSPVASTDLTASIVSAPLMRRGSIVVPQMQHLGGHCHNSLQMSSSGVYPLILQDQCILKTPRNLESAGSETICNVGFQNVNIYMRAYSAVVIHIWIAATNICISQELIVNIRDLQYPLSWVPLTVPTNPNPTDHLELFLHF